MYAHTSSSIPHEDAAAYFYPICYMKFPELDVFMVQF